MKPTGWLPGTQRREPLREPRAARVDADERGVVRDGGAHALGQRGERVLGVGQLRRRARSAAVIEPALQDQLRGDLVAHVARRVAPRAPASASAILRGRRRVALVDERDRQAEAAGELAREALRARASSRAACRRRAPAGRRRAARAAIRRSARRSRRSASASRSRSIVASGCATRAIARCRPRRRCAACRNRTRARSSAALARWHTSRVPDVLGQAREVDAEQRASPRAAGCSGGRSNSTSASAVDGEPRVLRELLLELAGRPARVAERHEHVLRALAAADAPRARPSTS